MMLNWTCKDFEVFGSVLFIFYYFTVVQGRKINNRVLIVDFPLPDFTSDKYIFSSHIYLQLSFVCIPATVWHTRGCTYLRSSTASRKLPLASRARMEDTTPRVPFALLSNKSLITSYKHNEYGVLVIILFNYNIENTLPTLSSSVTINMSLSQRQYVVQLSCSTVKVT